MASTIVPPTLGRAEQDVKDRRDPAQCHEDPREMEIALGAVIDRAGHHRSEYASPGLEEAHGAAYLGEVVAAEEITDRCPGCGKQSFKRWK